MASYYPDNVQSGNAFQERTGGLNEVACVWDIGSATLGTADVLYGPTVPAGARIIGVTLGATDLDTSNTLTLDVGDATDDNRLMNAASIGTAGGESTTIVAASRGYEYTAATQINVTPQAAAAGGVAGGVVTLKLSYIVVEATT